MSRDWPRETTEERAARAGREEQIQLIADGVVRGLAKWSLLCFVGAVILFVAGVIVRAWIVNS